ncbi:MAG: putative Zn-dependent protease [Lentisphaeria bacterium]|jgi:predicted Zn-dependent protease
MTDSHQYTCHGFHESLSKGKSSGTIHVDATGLLFIIKDQCLRMPFYQVKVMMGGANNRLVFFEHPLLAAWSFYASDRSILNDSHLKKQAAIAPILERAKNKHRAAWVLLILVIALAVAAPVALIFRMDILSKVVAQQVPAEWEEKLGDSVIAQYSLDHTFLGAGQTDQLLRPLVTPLVDAIGNSRYVYSFHIVNDSSPNAFALPGGEVVIHSALILKAESAEELLGVLGHEIVHVEEQHGVRNIVGATGVYMIASAVFGDVSGVLAVLSGAAPVLLNQSYSRRFETESDINGFALLLKANINPNGLASFFEKLIAQEKEQLENIEDKETRELVKDVLGFLSSHPASEQRVENLRKLTVGVSDTHSYRDLSSAFTKLQQAVKVFVTENEPQEEAVDD